MYIHVETEYIKQLRNCRANNYEVEVFENNISW